MKTLRQIIFSTLLAASLSITVAAQNSGGCIPGDTQSPPCAASQIVTDTETTASDTTNAEVNNTTEVVTAVTVELIETLLLIF